jgi:hypothetical protein
MRRRALTSALLLSVADAHAGPTLTLTSERAGAAAHDVCREAPATTACHLRCPPGADEDLRLQYDDGCRYFTSHVVSVLWLGTEADPCRYTVLALRRSDTTPTYSRDVIEVLLVRRGRADRPPLGTTTRAARRMPDAELVDHVRDAACEAVPPRLDAVRRALCEAPPEGW